MVEHTGKEGLGQAYAALAEILCILCLAAAARRPVQHEDLLPATLFEASSTGDPLKSSGEPSPLVKWPEGIVVDDVVSSTLCTCLIVDIWYTSQ